MFTKYIKHRNKLNRKENLLMDILHCDPHKPPQNHVKCWFLGNLSCNSNNSRNPVPPTKFSHSTATRPGNPIPQWTTKSSHNSIHHHRGRHQQNAICPLFHFRLHQSVELVAPWKNSFQKGDSLRVLWQSLCSPPHPGFRWAFT